MKTQNHEGARYCFCTEATASATLESLHIRDWRSEITDEKQRTSDYLQQMRGGVGGGGRSEGLFEPQEQSNELKRRKTVNDTEKKRETGVVYLHHLLHQPVGTI